MIAMSIFIEARVRENSYSSGDYPEGLAGKRLTSPHTQSILLENLAHPRKIFPPLPSKRVE